MAATSSGGPERPRLTAAPMRRGRTALLMVDNAALVAVLGEFSATVTHEFSTGDILRQLAQSATRVLEVAGVGVMAAKNDGLLRLPLATHPPRLPIGPGT